MAEVDADDDSIHRWVVYRYTFDPDRRERRHRVVGAFDNEAEFYELISRLGDEVRQLRDAGQLEATDHVSGRRLEPGYRQAQQARRLEWEAFTRRARRE